MLRLQVLALKKENYEYERQIIRRQNTEDAVHVESLDGRPGLLKKQRLHERQKEEKTREDKEERHTILPEKEKRIEQWIGSWPCDPYMQITRYTINMKPDNDQTGKGAHAIKQRYRIFVWKLSWSWPSPLANREQSHSYPF